MLHKYTGCLRTDRTIALKNLRAIRVALKIFMADTELASVRHYHNRVALRGAQHTARAIRAGRIQYTQEEET